jgi:hypothetical protein
MIVTTQIQKTFTIKKIWNFSKNKNSRYFSKKLNVKSPLPHVNGV